MWKRETLLPPKEPRRSTRSNALFALPPPPINQGKMVDVCMRPTSADVQLISLLDFTWVQKDLVTDPTGNTYFPGGTQPVVDPAAPDTKANPLSTDSNCPTIKPTSTVGTCGFSSMFRASFYDNQDVNVDGEGNVLLTLARR